MKTPNPKAKIELIIVGAQKSATTSLKHYLGDHPDLYAHAQKEIGYFLDEKEYALGIKRVMQKYYPRMGNNTGHKTLIAKSALMYTHEDALKRLKEYNKDIKIVFIARNPVERAYSAYLMNIDIVDKSFNLHEVKDMIENHNSKYLFIDTSIYVKYLKNIYKYFPKEQVKVVLYDDLKQNAIGVCKDIYQWLGVNTKFAPDTHKKYNPTQKRKSHTYSKLLRKAFHPDSVARKIFNTVVPEHLNYKVGDALRDLNMKKSGYGDMDPDTKAYLIEYFRPFNKELAELIGRDLSAWDK